mgnify:CR=1 FL=1
MARPISYNKRELEKKKLQKKKEKQKRKEERKANAGGGSLDDMIAYVDENGVITDTPPDPEDKTKIKAEDIEVSVPKKEETEDPVHKGRVEFFKTDKGYGFIRDLSDNEKYFFHINDAFPEIGDGAQVTFELAKGPRGMNAINVSSASE